MDMVNNKWRYKMKQDMIYKLRILILETYVRITMIGYESKQEKNLNAGSVSRQFLQGNKT